MLLTAGAEVIKFIQILCWIVLPLLLSAIGVTIYLHYRKKKMEVSLPVRPGELILPSPERVSHRKENGEYIYFDHSGIIREYKDRLSYNHARYAALQQDFSVLETKYSSLALYATHSLLTIKQTDMKNLVEQLPPHLQEEVNKLAATHQTEKEELMARLEQLGKSYESLEQENESLLEQMNLGTATEEEKALLGNRWRQESILLKDKVAEQEYLKDVLEEKKSQIEFLQHQLEQRIKNQHQSEQQREQAIADREEANTEKQQLLNQAEQLRTGLSLKQDQMDKLQMLICEKEELLSEKQQLLSSKLDHITYIENVLHESKQQNEILSAVAADSAELAGSLQRQLEDERSRLAYTEQRLAANKQILRRLHKEFSAFMDEDSDRSPVIALRPDLITEGVGVAE